MATKRKAAKKHGRDGHDVPAAESPRYNIVDLNDPMLGGDEEDRWQLEIGNRLAEIGNEIATHYADKPEEYIVAQFLEIMRNSLGWGLDGDFDNKKNRQVLIAPLPPAPEKRRKARDLLFLFDDQISRGSSEYRFYKEVAEFNKRVPRERRLGSGATTHGAIKTYIKTWRKKLDPKKA